MVKTPYILHIEDDWEFYTKQFFIKNCINVINSNPKIKQCLFNQNYGETTEDINILGGMHGNTASGYPYYIHDHCDPAIFNSKYGPGPNCSYWPSFSFRPSVIRTDIFTEIGDFNENCAHFELDYANNYTYLGYLSAFLPGIRCVHTGRLTSERNNPDKPNAYLLNDQPQFVSKSIGSESERLQCFIQSDQNVITRLQNNMEIYVVNLDTREDRWNNFKNITKDFNYFTYNRFPAVNGYAITKNIHMSKLFDGNDYNMRSGMVGCALSHIQLAIKLLESNKEFYVILEDDIKLASDFEDKLTYLYTMLPIEWDIMYIGHHIKKQFINENTMHPYRFIKTIYKSSTRDSLNKSLGGTIGYLLSRKGAENMLTFINERGMTNGIDTVQQKMGDQYNIYYCEPHLLYSECADNTRVDSDIQYDYTSLTIGFEDRLKEEHSFYQTHFHGIITDNYEDAVNHIKNRETVVYDDRENQKIRILMDELENIKDVIHYTIGGRGLVCIASECANDLFYSNRSQYRLKWYNNDRQYWEWSLDKILN